jgi:hypothetical protein
MPGDQGPAVAYVAAGKLHVTNGSGSAQPIESQFAQSMRQRMLELHQRHEWKAQGRGAQFMRGGGVLWGTGERDPAEIPIRITGVSRGSRDGELFYTLTTPEVGGLFRIQEGAEQRLFHTNDYRVSHVASGPGGRIACVCNHRSGTSSIAVLRDDGSEMNEVTQGDTQDASPSWASATEIVFQSAGMARNQAGYAVGRGPFTLQKIDVEGGRLQTVAEDPKADLLGPKMAADGTLYYIRRPYEPPMAKVSFGRAVLDLLLLPFRLLYALFQFINFFTMRYTGKGLTTAGGTAQREADVRQMMIWGNLVNAQKAAREAGDDDAPALVPKTWELVKQDRSGATEVLERGVVHFDLCPDGAVLYSNGSALFLRHANGKTERLLKDALIEQVAAL